MPYEEDREEDTAFILDKLIQRNENKSIAIVGEVDYIFDTYPDYLNKLKDNNFFNFSNLKSYYEVMYKEELDYHQIIWEFGTETNTDWVHIGYKISGNKKINTRAKKSNGKTSYVTFDIQL